MYVTEKNVLIIYFSRLSEGLIYVILFSMKRVKNLKIENQKCFYASILTRKIVVKETDHVTIPS